MLAASPAPSPAAIDARFHPGAIHVATGNPSFAGPAPSQADTILAERPTHLLGLILAVKATTLARKDTGRRTFRRPLLGAQGRELALPLNEYLQHRPLIDNALRTARATP